MAEATDTEGRPTERTMTTAMLKAIANPLRRRIMRVFTQREFVRAADIAEDLGEPANKISFHLRVLADAGLIVEAPEQARDGRDRVWTPIKDSLRLRGSTTDPDDFALSDAVIAALTEDHLDLVHRLVAHSTSVAAQDPADHGTLSVSNLRLTEAEYSALMDKLTAAIVDAERTRDKDAGDARGWQIDIVAADDTI
ncbi:ArsR/SmtB family transcription factor [Microbacterium sp. NPDC056234]|uniref:ArsR/SmtB family transcription factor n=1 Tax=Microbacterium sp. NPDC056234 TaxID=3345757 RepID=UPI0035E2C2E1